MSAKEDLVAENFEQDDDKKVHCVEQMIANNIKTRPYNMEPRLDLSAKEDLAAKN